VLNSALSQMLVYKPGYVHNISADLGANFSSPGCYSHGRLSTYLNPIVAYLCREKTPKSASDVAAHRLGQVEAYLTVRQVLSEASTAADGALSRERSGFYRCRYTTLGLTQPTTFSRRIGLPVSNGTSMQS
jgi:hypothetical protein